MPTNDPISNADQIVLNEQDEVQHILGHPPSWILRWGISLVFIAVMIFMLLSWLIKYPDIIPARVILISEQPAIRLVANQSGKLKQLFVEDKQQVKAGDLLAVIDNTAEWSDVQQLEAIQAQAEKVNTPKGWLQLLPDDQLSIGQMQATYATFLQRLRSYQYFLRQSDVVAKIASLDTQVEQIKELNATLVRQQETMKEELEIAQKNLKRNQTLRDKGLISEVELEVAETTYLQNKRQVENQGTQVLNNKIRIEQINSQVIELRQGRSDGKADGEVALRNDIQRIKSEVESWKQNYLLVAAISGQVSMSKVWSRQQFVNINEEVFTIVPSEGRGKIVGRASLPMANSGKVKTGMRANIRLDGYPYQEFGVVRALVSSTSLVPLENNYLLEISLPEDLVTTYDKDIIFQQEMQGIANIITEDRRIITRIFDKVLSILKNT